MADNNAAVLTKEYVPQEFQNEEYVKPWLDKPWGKETAAEVFKKLVNAEQLIGKRPSVPTRDAKDDELDKFFTPFRPDKADDYEIKLTEGRPKPDEGFVKAVREAFYEGKLSKFQAGKVLVKLQEYGMATEKAAADEKVKKAKEFDVLAKSMLGEQNKLVMERVKNTMQELAPAAAKGNLDKITDDNLVIMASIINSIMEKYVPEKDLAGKGKGGAGGAGSGSTTAAELREEAKKLMATKAYTNWQDPEYEKTVARVNEIYKEVGSRM